MPPIQRYQQQTRRSGRTGEIEQSAEQFSASGKAIAAVGGALSEVVDGMTKAQEHQQKTQALNNAKMMKADIVARFAADPDPNNYEQYVAELTDVSGKASEGITLRNAKSAFDLDFSSEANSGLMEMNKLKRTKIVELGAMAVQQELDMHVQDYLNADPAGEARAITNIDMALEQGMANGYFTPKEAAEMRDKNINEIGKDKAYARLGQANTVEEIEALKTSIKAGDFERNGEKVTPEEKATILSKLETKSKKIATEQKAAVEKQYDDNMKQAMLDMFDGRMSISEAQRLFRAGILKESDYNSIERKLITPDYAMLKNLKISDPEAFNEVREHQINKDLTPGQIARKIMDYTNEGKIKADDAKYLTERTQELPPTREDILAKAGADSIREWANSQVNLGFIDRLTNPEKKSQEVESIVKDFYDQVDQGKLSGDAIAQVAKQVKTDYLKKRFPELNDMEDIPHILIGVGGKIQRLLGTTDKTTVKPRYKISKVEDKKPESQK